MHIPGGETGKQLIIDKTPSLAYIPVLTLLRDSFLLSLARYAFTNRSHTFLLGIGMVRRD